MADAMQSATMQLQHDARVLHVTPAIVAAIQCPCARGSVLQVMIQAPATCPYCRRVHTVSHVKAVTPSPGKFKFQVKVSSRDGEPPAPPKEDSHAAV